MVCPREVFLDFLELRVEGENDAVVLTVHGALLQRCVQLGEGDGKGLSAPRLEQLDIHRQLWNADLQAFEVVGRRHFLHAVGQAPEVILVELKGVDAKLIEDFAIPLGNDPVAIKECVSTLIGRHDVGQEPRLEPLVHARGRMVQPGTVEAAVYQTLAHLDVAPELTTGIHGHIQ